MNAETSGLLNLFGGSLMHLADSNLPTEARDNLRILGFGMRKLAKKGDMGGDAKQLIASMNIRQGSQSADLAQAVQKTTFQIALAGNRE